MEHLRSLSGVRGYVPDARWYSGVWLLRGAEPPLFAAPFMKTAGGEFDVFTLGLLTGEQVLASLEGQWDERQELREYLEQTGVETGPPPPQRVEPPDAFVCPIELEQVSLLIQREWRARYSQQPEGYVFDPKAAGLGPEATPLGTEHAWWRDAGILLRGAGRSTLICLGPMYDVIAETDPAEIAECVGAWREVSLETYLVERAAEL